MRYRLFFVLMLLVLPATGLAQTTPRLRWEQYDNVAEIQRDGSVRVREQQVIVVDQGPLNGMTRTFPTGDNGRVSNIRVSEDGQAYRPGSNQRGTYEGGDTGEQARIRVNFRDPNAAQHSITLEYTLSRTLIESSNGATFDWNFFWSGNAPQIRNGSVVVQFPDQVVSGSLRTNADGVSVRETTSSNSVRWELTQPIQGEQLRVQAAFPRTILGADAQFRTSGAPAGSGTNSGSGATNPVPNAGTPPVATPGFAFGNAIFCFFMLFMAVIAFSIIRASARARQRGGYPPVAGPSTLR